MSRSALIVAVALSAYALLDLAVSLLTALIWRTRAVAPADLPPAVRARRLLQLRLAPSLTAALLTLLVITPAFALFEPPHAQEEVGPVIEILVALAVLQLGRAIAGALGSAWMTRRIARQWLHGATPIAADRAAGLRAFAIDTRAPMVALVGVFSPTLMASRGVLEACSAGEIASIAGHERGHFDARDNLKRWLMASLPDLLRWTRVHHEIVEAWHHAAEDAADDAATGGHAEARVELAALLLKIVRLTPAPVWSSAIVSPFVGQDGLERRVRRLLRPELEPQAPVAIVPLLVVTAIAAGIIAAVMSPGAMEAVFLGVERVIAFRR
jgi:Zn-dependent protease with chaperone function